VEARIPNSVRAAKRSTGRSPISTAPATMTTAATIA
jgi:hypothetical protein